MLQDDAATLEVGDRVRSGRRLGTVRSRGVDGWGRWTLGVAWDGLGDYPSGYSFYNSARGDVEFHRLHRAG